MNEKLKNWAKTHKKEIALVAISSVVGVAVGNKFGTHAGVKTKNEFDMYHTELDNMFIAMMSDPAYDPDKLIRLVLTYGKKD